MEFIFEIKNYDNAAMVENPEGETARLLRKVAEQVENGTVYGSLMDYNGNKVGEWEFITE